MNGNELIRLVDMMHRDRNIAKDVIFEGIEAALQLAAERAAGITGEDENEPVVTVHIDRANGQIIAKKGEEPIDPEMLGRIAAQSAKQVMIQKIREAECNARLRRIRRQEGRPGSRHRSAVRGRHGDRSTLGKTEAILPRSEQIPGETHHVGERVKAVILDVRKVGHRVKIILSRTPSRFRAPALRGRDSRKSRIAPSRFKAIAREAGYRTKIAVSSIDMKVDCVGACVGVRGSRIKNIVDELGGERIDIVRWNDSLQVMIPNALQPAEIEEVFLYPRLGRAIVLVQGRSTVAGHRPARAERAAGVEARRLGHRDHDPRRVQRGHRPGRRLVQRRFPA